MSFDQAEYERADQEKEIVDVLDRAVSFISNAHPRPPELASFGEAAAVRLARLVPALKTPAYAREVEWRIVKWMKSSSGSPEFDASKGVVRPFVHVQLPKPLPILSLHVMAPTRRDVALKAAAMLLTSAGVRVQPEHSDIPFAE